MSSYLKSRTVSKGSEKSIPTLTELQKLLKVIQHSIISLAGIPSSGIAAKHDSLWGYQKQPYSRRNGGVCRHIFRGNFPGFGRWWTLQV